MPTIRLAAVLSIGLAMAAGCSATFYTEQADREVYGIVADKSAKALGRVPIFTIKPRTDVVAVLKEAKERPAGQASGSAGVAASAAGASEGGAAQVTAAPAGAKSAAEGARPDAALPPPVPEPGPDAIRLTVADALRVAVRASREYQTQKETVYLAALALTLERYLFRPHPFATGTVNLKNVDDAGDRRKSWDGGAEVGISQQLADGAVVVGSLGLAALKFINRELGDAVDSTLDFTLTQPLWRGAGRKIVQENLTQAERNALYAVRSFAKFEQDFAVDIATRFLRVLQQRDRVLNAWQNYLSLKEGRERAEWLAKAERLPEFQVDQARQDELRAYNSWIVEREDYVNSLDAFKITLGLPVTEEIVLDPGELDRLIALGLEDMKIDLAEATARALVTRLDLANVRDALADAERKVMVAEDGLKGDVDLVASIGYASRGDAPQSAHLSFRRGDYSVGLSIDLPVDRLQERNALRQTQIARERAARDLERFRDDVVLEVRRAVRRLQQARESYEIQKRSVALAERRVESTQLLLQAGRASQRDVLEAQRALLDARNALTAALVAHSIAGLELQRDVGTLVVDDEGQIHGWNLTSGGR